MWVSTLVGFRLRCWVAGMVVVLAGASACAPAYHEALRIGTNVWPGYEPLYLAQVDEGLSERDVRLAQYVSASQVLDAYRDGAIDGAALTLDEAVRLEAEGYPVEVVLVTDVSAGADAIVAQPEIVSLRGLAGRRVGVETGGVGGYLLHRALRTVGLTTADVTVVPLEVAEHERAWTERSVEAVVTFEPALRALRAAGGVVLFDTADIADAVVDVVVGGCPVVRRT